MAATPVVWTDTAAVLRALGPSTSTADAPYIADCVAAANEWSWRKRQEAGYTNDVRDTPPSLDVQLGATLYAVALFRERGSADSFASFDESAGFATTGTYPRIKQLLGIGRGQTDALPAGVVVQPLTRRHPSASRGPMWVP